jgi:hypothetical protein
MEVLTSANAFKKRAKTAVSQCPTGALMRGVQFSSQFCPKKSVHVLLLCTYTGAVPQV